MGMSHGVSFAVGPDGSRSTTATGRGVVADALRAAHPVGARAVENETAWRSRHLQHFRRLVEAGIDTPAGWLSIADAGLRAVHDRLVVAGTGRRRRRRTAVHPADGRAVLDSDHGGAARSGGPLHGSCCCLIAVGRCAATHCATNSRNWARDGVLEPSAANAVGEVIGHPEGLPLDGDTVVVLGAGAEMGPVAPLLGWGARVAAVDLPR